MGFLKKNGLFSYRFFFRKESQTEIFFDILDIKECSLDLKSEVLTKSKKSRICKGLVHGFCKKIDLFLICFF